MDWACFSTSYYTYLIVTSTLSEMFRIVDKRVENETQIAT